MIPVKLNFWLDDNDKGPFEIDVFMPCMPREGETIEIDPTHLPEGHNEFSVRVTVGAVQYFIDQGTKEAKVEIECFIDTDEDEIE
jgi:hypothetical protein